MFRKFKQKKKVRKKKVSKYLTKILQVSPKKKKIYILGCPSEGGGDSGFLVYLLPNTTSTTPPVPLPILLNPNSTYSRLHALGTYCRWQKPTTSWQGLLCTSGPEVIMTRGGEHWKTG